MAVARDDDASDDSSKELDSPKTRAAKELQARMARLTEEQEAKWRQNACRGKYEKRELDPVKIPLGAYVSMCGVLAGLAVGYWPDLDTISAQWQAERTFHPEMNAAARKAADTGWNRAVRATLAWAEDR